MYKKVFKYMNKNIFNTDNIVKSFENISKSDYILQKGSMGNWKDEGYTIHHSNLDRDDHEAWDAIKQIGNTGLFVKPKGSGEDSDFVSAKEAHSRISSGNHKLDFMSPFVYVKDRSGNVVGGLTADGNAEILSSSVHKDHRRKGLASAMYDHLSEITGMEVQPGGSRSQDAKALWASRDGKNIKNNSKKINKKESALDLMMKSDGNHPIHNSKPHFMFSAEAPRFENKLNYDHDKAVNLLRDKGYQVEEMTGKYGGVPEKSILVHNPSKSSLKNLMKMAKMMGQEAAIYSDGYNHEMHYLNGENSGKHQKGQGTEFHDKEPKDFFSKLPDGTHFTHRFEESMYEPNESILNLKNPEKINKSEESNVFRLKKNEEEGHPLENASPDMKLIHYSPEKGLKIIDPAQHGKNRIGAEYKRGIPEVRTSFFYLSGSKPESIVTQGAKSKYVSSLGDKRLYDLGKDPDKIHERVKNKASSREYNPGVVNRDDLLREVQDSGYHGFYNSKAGSMKDVVAMFEPMNIEQEHDIHPMDHKLASHVNYNIDKDKMNEANEKAKEHGLHSGKFLYHLDKYLDREK